MSQKQGGSKITQSFQMGKIKRKNSTFGTSGAKDFQLTEQQAQLIQSKLPKKFRLINLENGDLEKIRQQLRINSSKNIQQHQIKPQIMIEDKKIHKKPGGKIKRGTTFSDKKYSQDDLAEPIQQAQEKHEKNKKEPAYKKKASLKYNVELPSEIPLSMSQINEHSEKQIKKIKQQVLIQPSKQKHPSVLQGIGQIISANSALPLKQQLEQHISNSYIPSLPNCQPRHIPLPLDFQYDGNAQINTLRYMFGLGFKLPPEQITKLNEKQKNFSNQIIQRLKAHKSSQPFRLPVDPQGQGVPDYFHVVYNPMDLQTIHRKIMKDKYKQISQFHFDVNTIILNSYKYNLRQTVYFQLTVQFEDYYQKLLRMAEKNPQQFTKEYVPKERKKKPIQDLGERDFTEKTPIKERKKSNSSKDNLNYPEKQRKSRNAKMKNIFDDINVSGVISQLVNQQAQSDNSQESQFKIKPKQRGRQKDKQPNKEQIQHQQVEFERSREKRSKQAVLKNLNLQKAQSLPQSKQQLDLFSEYHNTHSNNSNLMYPTSYNSYNQQHGRKKPKNRRKSSPIKQKVKENIKISQRLQIESISIKQITTQKQNQLSNIIPQRYTQQQQNIFQNQFQQTQSINLNNQELPIQKQFAQIINSRRSNRLNDDYNDVDQIEQSYYKDQQKIEDQGSELGISVLGDKNQNDGYKNNNMKQSAHALDQQIQYLVNSGIYEGQQKKPQKIICMIEPSALSKPKLVPTSLIQYEQPQFYVPIKPKQRFANTSRNPTWQYKEKKQKNQPQKQINIHTTSSINVNNISNIPNMPVMPNGTNIQSSTNQQISTISNNTEHENKSNQIKMYLNPKNNTYLNMIQQQNRTSQKYRANANINQQEKYITINNLNTHPVHFKDIKEQRQFLEEPKEQNKIKQQVEILAAVQEKQSKANTETVVQKHKIIAKPKKNKNKDKNGDDQYRASSQDEEYIANQPRYIKRGKTRAPRGKPSLRQNKDSSDDGNPIKRRRGRIPKKLKQQMSQYINPKIISQQQNQMNPSENKPGSPVRNLRSFFNEPTNLPAAIKPNLYVPFSKSNIPAPQQKTPIIQKPSIALIQKSNIQTKKPEVTFQDKPEPVHNLYGDQIFIDKPPENEQIQEIEESFPFFD